MNNEALKIIKSYLFYSTYYGKKLYNEFKSRKGVENDKLSYIVHGNGINVIDLDNNVKIDFDFFNYHGGEILYFHPWKLNLFSKLKYDFEFSKDLINDLEKKGYIKKYHKSGYYYLI